MFFRALGIVVGALCAAGSIVPPSALAAAPDHSLVRVNSDKLGGAIQVDPELFAKRHQLLSSIDQTREFLHTEEGREKLAAFERAGINPELLDQSLGYFAILLRTSRSPKEFGERLSSSFDLFRSVGSDGQGSVRFTGYFRPVYEASRVRTHEYKYPLFRPPPQLGVWKEQQRQPTRVQLEGGDGLAGKGALLTGYELAFVRTRFEAFMIHVQGSAVLQFPNGEREAIGFAGATDFPFKGVPVEFLRRKKISWGKMGEYFSTHPGEFDTILSKNNRFIFFDKQGSADPIGSLGLPVVDERSIAIDQSHLPPGAVSIIRTALPQKDSRGQIRLVPQSRFVLNLDSGSAIRGPGRVDLFMGTGEEARKRANYINGNGELYYLFVKRKIVASLAPRPPAPRVAALVRTDAG